MKKILTIFAATIFVVSMSATELTVADGTSTNASLPICVYYMDYLHQGQMLYPAIEIAAMKGGEISGLTFYSTTDALSFGAGIISVKLAEVDNTALSNKPLTPEFTEVFNGSCNIASGKLVIAFTTNFTYSGTKNLLVSMSVVTRGTASSDDVWFYGQTLAGAGYSRYVKKGTFTYEEDVVGFLPKTTFVYSASAPVCAQPLSVDATTVVAKEASINWSKADAMDQVQYALVEEGAEVVWSDPTTDGSKSFTGLKPLTNYNFYVRTYCSASEQSAPIKTSFTTDKACHEPKDLQVGSITHNSALITWNNGGAEFNYQYVVVESGETPDWTEANEDGSHSVTLSGLQPATAYDVYLRSKCDVGEFSDAVTESFTTECGPITVLPWEENFKKTESGKLPLCWESSVTGSPYVPGYGTRLEFKFEAPGIQTVTLPEFGVRLDTLAITFTYYTDEQAATLKLGYINAEDKFAAIESYPTEKTATTIKNVKLTAVGEAARYLAFQYVASEDGGCYVNINSITVHVPEIETGVESIQPSDRSDLIQKVIRDGQLYLMYNGTMYNVQGVEVK